MTDLDPRDAECGECGILRRYHGGIGNVPARSHPFRERVTVEQALREALAANDLALYSASGAHVFDGERAIRDLAAGLAARLPRATPRPR